MGRGGLGEPRQKRRETFDIAALIPEEGVIVGAAERQQGSGAAAKIAWPWWNGMISSSRL